MSGLLTPDIEEKILGSAEILQIFKVSSVGKVAGSKVLEGEISNGSSARLVRDGKLSLVEAASGGHSIRTSGAVYARRDYARTESLLHYFDDEWFDFAGMRSENQ